MLIDKEAVAHKETLQNHELRMILPVEWNYIIPFGLLHSPKMTKCIQDFSPLYR